MKFIDFILIMLMILACFLFLEAANTPVVYWSTSKNECVKIEVRGEDCGCSELPDKYERIWVK